MELWTGFLVGLLGSLHCVGMCGPIALALPVFSESRIKILFGRILYNIGRVITYSIMGALFGLFGSRVVLFGLQQDLSILIGVLILIYIITPRRIKTRVSGIGLYKIITNFLKTHYGSLISKRTNNSLLIIGLLNGLLPCGFVYIGIAGALSTGSWLNGTAYMALFGLGTTPIMLLTSIIGRVININIKRRINKIIPAFAVILALLFILRGLNIGIPYLSPKYVEKQTVESKPKTEIDCCH